MIRTITLSTLLCFSYFNSFSQCAETQQPKVLLVGDSWAFFMNFEQTITNVFRKWGHSDSKFVSSGNLAVNGAETRDFLKPEKQAEIAQILTANPSIIAVHLSIGGNDMLGDWKVSMSQGQTDTIMTTVLGRLDSIVQFIKSVRPGIRILWSGYTYPNFGEGVLQGPSLFSGPNHPFYDTWSGMEFPNFLQINTILNDVSAKMETYAAADPQVDFVNATGILQYTTGQTTPLQVAPGGTYPAFTVPLPLGDPSYPSPLSTMRDFVLTKDCYHLSTTGYFDFVEYHTRKFYHKLLMNNFYALSENNTQTGSVTSQGNVSDSLLLGESNGEQFSTVLSFNTTTMFDTVIGKASIFLRRSSLTGTNPISGSLEVKIKNGNFGSSVNIEPSDLNDTPDATGTPCLLGSNNGNGHWIRLDLPTALLPFIKNNAPTQFIISAPGFTGGRVNFFDSSDPDFAPVLNLTYGPTQVTSVEEPTINSFTIYPNPTDNALRIINDGEPVLRVEIVNLMGKSIAAPVISDNTIDVSFLSAGLYILNVTTERGIASKRFVKF